MSRVVSYQCDFTGCSATRADANHWFTVFQTKSLLQIFAFDPTNISEAELMFCGEAHLQQFLSSKLGDLFPRPEAEPAPQAEPIPQVNTEVHCIHCKLAIRFSTVFENWIHSSTISGTSYYACNLANNADGDPYGGKHATPPEGTPIPTRKA